MPKNISTISINASPQRVWEVLTQPELVKAWQFGSKLETSWKPGDRIEFVTEWQGKVFRQWGVVKDFQPPDRLAYTLFAPRPDLPDVPENYFLMEYELTQIGSSTRLEIIQTDSRPGAKQEPPQGSENPILKGLKDLAEQLPEKP